MGDHLSMGTELVGDHLSRGNRYYGDVCPGGQEVGDRKSGDQMGSRPNASQPNLAIRSETEYGEYEKKNVNTVYECSLNGA